MNNSIDEVLESLGLTKIEVKLYKKLLFDGPSTAGILSSKTGVHRRNTYDALERLISKGLVSYIVENNTKKYSPNDPEIVLNRIKNREKQWLDLIPELEKQMSLWEDRKETLFFRGIDGIKNIFLDQIKVGKEILVEATNIDVSETVKYFFPKYQLLRKENKIKTRMLFDTSFKNKKLTSILAGLPLSKVKFLKDFNNTKVSHYIYGDNLAIITWGEVPFAILVREKSVADVYRQKFELLWKLGVKKE
jgi:HTH-type transcriptional regulator, sugar sensing transcriptional regulator